MDDGAMQILTVIYYVSQVLILIVACTAAIFAYRQVKFISYFELTKFLQSEKLRRDRKTAYYLVDHPKDLKDWSREEEDAVSNVFSSFDVVGMLANRSLIDIDFFAEFYQDAIVQLHEGHEVFLQRQRARKSDRLWLFMEQLYKAALEFKDASRSSKIYK